MMTLAPQALISEVLEQLQGSWRYRWVAVAATWIVCVLGWLYVFILPDIYRASARVHVETESLIGPLMQGLTTQQRNVSGVELVNTVLLTRPNLERVARETGLDLRTSSSDEFESLVTALQSRIRVSGGRDNVFAIEYEDTTREMARDVVAAMVDTFVEGEVSARGDDAELSGRALAGEIEEHEQRLNAAEASLAEFKKNNVGYMPNESGDYYGQLQTALGAVASTEAQIRQLVERRDELTRQIEGEEPVFGIMPSAGACPESAQIIQLETQRTALLVDFTELHPRVVALRDQIAALEQRCAESAGMRAPAATLVGGDTLELNPVYQNLRVQLSNAEVDLVEARGRLRSQEATVARLRADVDKIANVETQLKQLNRDYSVVQTRHQELLRRWEDLQAKKRLDPVTDSVQFRRIEPPFALPAPVGPNRPLLIGGVLAVSLGLGFALAFGMHFLSPVFSSPRSLRQVSGLPVLGSVGMLLDSAAKRHRRNVALAWVASYLLLLVSAAAVVLFANRGSELLRSMLEGLTA